MAVHAPQDALREVSAWLGAQQRAGEGHEEGGRHSFAGDIADGKTQLPRAAAAKDVVEIRQPPARGSCERRC